MKKLLQFLLFIPIAFNVSTAQTTLFATGSTWKYNDQGQDLGTTWITSGYNDASWSSGTSEFGYGDGDEQTVVSYRTDSDNKYPTTYFRKTFYVANPSQYQQILGAVRRDDGVIVYVNGVEVFRNNLPFGDLNYTTLATSTVAFSDEDNYLNFAFSPALLNNGNNTIAVSIHQDDVSSSDISFNMSLTGALNSISAQLTREPYLNSGTPSSVIVKWQTDVPCDSKVWFGTSISNLNLVQNGFTYTTDHEVTITGLQPSTTYFYKIGYTGTVLADVNANQYFKTSPEIGETGTYRFWAIGDAGMSDGNQRDVRDGFLTYNGNAHVDGWILLGDNAYGNGINDGTQSCYQTALFDQMYSAVISRTICWPATGNHDYNNHIPFSPSPAYYDIFTLPASGEAGGVPSGTEKYYSYNYGNIHFIVLDSYDEGRNSSDPMALWLIADLAANTQPWTIAYWHHPPYTKGSHDSDNSTFIDFELPEIRQNIVPIIENGGVDLVLNGHSHSYERSYLLDGHYGNSNTLSPSMILDNGSGNFPSSCPYQKQTDVSKAHKGTVYAVCGCSGKLSSTSSGWPHPAMYRYSSSIVGSMLIEVNDNKLEAKFIDSTGVVADGFTIVKNAGTSTTISTCPGENRTLKPSWPATVEWFPSGITADSLVVNPLVSTVYYAYDAISCIKDTFIVNMLPAADCSITGVQEDAADNRFIVYPTIMSGADVHINVRYLPGIIIDELTIYDAYGKQYAVTTTENTSGSSISFSASNLSSGIYFVALTLNDTKKVFKKIIITD